MFSSLYNPDLVREQLAEKPQGEVRRATAVVNLNVVLDSGPAPPVAITSPAPNAIASGDLVDVTAKVTDQGKGVGRVEYRVNGVTAAVVSRPDSAGPDYVITKPLALEAGTNTIEVVAYNGSNLLASLPATTKVNFAGAKGDGGRARLHILAIGINAYVDKGNDAPSSGQHYQFVAREIERRHAG